VSQREEKQKKSIALKKATLYYGEYAGIMNREVFRPIISVMLRMSLTMR
jgi:hypothetical protein